MGNLLLASLILTAACVDSNSPTATTSRGPAVAATRNAVDTVGLPDLIVDAKATQQNWLVRVDDFPSNFAARNSTPSSRQSRALLLKV